MPRIDWYTFSISGRLLFVVAGVSSLSWAGVALAAPMSISVPLTGAEQLPPVQTPGKGTAELTYDPDTRIVTWTVTFSDLLGSGYDGPFSRAGDGRQERPGDTLADEQGLAGRKPDQGQRDADA
jgi:CHRD domain